jgi:hypothetical protein
VKFSLPEVQKHAESLSLWFEDDLAKHPEFVACLPSHEGAAAEVDRALAVCRRAGFRALLLRGDTDFSQTEHLDRWHAERRGGRCCCRLRRGGGRSSPGARKGHGIPTKMGRQ